MSDALALALVELKRDEVLGAVKDKAESGDEPLKILEECRRGMTIVGDRFQSGEFYLAEMMLATLKWDIHDLGKDIVATLLRARGFEVQRSLRGQAGELESLHRNGQELRTVVDRNTKRVPDTFFVRQTS